MEDPSFLEDMEKIQREMCNIKGNFMSLIFDRKNFIELIEWLHESYLSNNEVIDKLTIQNIFADGMHSADNISGAFAGDKYFCSRMTLTLVFSYFLPFLIDF